MLKIQNSTGSVLAYLNNLVSASVHEVLNGEYTLNFIAIVEPLKTEYLYDNTNLINYEDDLFRVVQYEELHNEDDGVTIAVTAEHISYDLINNVINSFNYTYKTGSEVMLACLANTGFTLRTVTVTKKTDIQYTEECNSKQISIAIANNWGGELQYDRYYVDLLARRGANRDVDFRFGKNLKTVKRIRNFAENATSYEVEVVQGTELEELGYFELGDTIRVIDDRLNADYEVRIIELEKDILANMNSKVILGDEIKDLRSSFSSRDKKIDEAKDSAEQAKNTADTVGHYVDVNAPNWNKISNITNDLGNVIPSKIVGDLNLAITQIMNSTGTFSQKDNMLYWQNQPTFEASTFASMWNAAGISFANSKEIVNSQTVWKWQSALNAEGLVATKVLASALYGLTVEAVTLVAANITSGSIKGVTIEGSTIYAGNRATGNYTALDSTGNFSIYTNGSRQLEIFTASDGGFIYIYDQGTPIFQIKSTSTGGWISLANHLGDQAWMVQADSVAYNGFVMGAGDMSDGSNAQFFANIYNIEGTGTSSRFYASVDIAYFFGSLSCTGTKPATVQTEHYGWRQLFAEESDRLYFNTKGIQETHLTADEKYQYVIRLDPIFLETIELNSMCPYIINVTPYSKAFVWVKAVYDKYIIVESDIECKFAYNLQAIRKGYSEHYLTEVNMREEKKRGAKTWPL